MELSVYLRALRKSWWLICCTAILAGSATGLIALRQPDAYASTVTFFATTPSSGPNTGSLYAGDQFAQQRVNTYVSLLSSDRLAALLRDQSGVDQPVEDIQSSIQGESQPNTVLLTATIKTASAEDTDIIAAAVAAKFPELVKAIEGARGAKTPLVTLDVVDGPSLDPVPVRPSVRLYVALGVVVGLAVGVGLALLREILDTTVRSVEALHKLTGVPVLGVIGKDPGAKKSPLIISSRSHSFRAEAFRQLRTNIQFVDVDQATSVFVVTSAVPGEGKSTTSANLAITFAEAGRSVLLIDADLRRPKVSELFGLEGELGLTNVLANQVRFDAVVQHWGTAGLAVLVSGSIPPNPSELLGSRHMAELMRVLRRQYEIVILDTPPLLPVTDAAVVAAHADGGVVVVRYGSTKGALISAAVDSLRAVDARVLGTVLNFVSGRGTHTGAAYRAYGAYGPRENDPADEPAVHKNSPSRDGVGDVPDVGSAGEAGGGGVRSVRVQRQALPTARLGLRVPNADASNSRQEQAALRSPRVADSSMKVAIRSNSNDREGGGSG